MQTGDFESILNRSVDEIPEPSLYPTGTWRLRVVQVATSQDDDGHDVFKFAFIGVEPQEDVDPSELEAAQDGLDGQKIWVRRTIENNVDAHNLVRLFTMLGLETKGQTFADLAKEARGSEVLGYVGTRSYQTRDGETKTDNTVRQFAPVDQALAA